MAMIDYKRVKCPKCGKSYFRVKENNDFNVSFLVFMKKPDPIYKNGELQNLNEAEPIKLRCECLECGCNFRIETHDVFGDYRFIDEDEKLEENKKRLAESFEVLKMKTEKAKTELIVEMPCQIESRQSIAIMPTPKGCGDCPFHWCVYQHPFWCKEKPNRKGYSCQLDKQKRVLDLDINDEFTTANWCPLKPYKETE